MYILYPKFEYAMIEAHSLYLGEKMFEHNRKIKALGAAAVIVVLILFAAGSIRFQSVKQYQEGRTGFEILQSETQSESGKTGQQTEPADGEKGKQGDETVNPTPSDERGQLSDGNAAGESTGSFESGNGQAVQTVAETQPDVQSGEEDDADSRDGQPEQQEYITCSIEIRCDSAAAKKSEIQNPGILASIPDDGTILARTAYRVPKGTTVYELLTQAAVQNQIPIAANSKGTYVSSINNLAEKMVGLGSGWTYRVNSKMVMKPASFCVLEEEDVIQWIYVTGYK